MDVTIERLIKHTKRYGREGVDEYAATVFTDVRSLTEALERLDRVSPPPGKRPQPAERRAMALLGITEEEA